MGELPHHEIASAGGCVLLRERCLSSGLLSGAACGDAATPVSPRRQARQPSGVEKGLRLPVERCGRDRIPGSQNVGGWKGPLWVTQSNPLPKQGHPQQAAQHHGQAGLEYLQRRRLHSLPRQPGPGLRHPQREEVLPRVQLELPLLQFVPAAPCPVAGHHWKESGPIV